MIGWTPGFRAKARFVEFWRWLLALDSVGRSGRGVVIVDFCVATPPRDQRLSRLTLKFLQPKNRSGDCFCGFRWPLGLFCITVCNPVYGGSWQHFS